MKASVKARICSECLRNSRKATMIEVQQARGVKSNREREPTLVEPYRLWLDSEFCSNWDRNTTSAALKGSAQGTRVEVGTPVRRL